jgi:hypothetical protein
MKYFDMPKGSRVLVNVRLTDSATGKKEKRAWHRCTVIGNSVHVGRRDEWAVIHVAETTEEIKFGAARIDSHVMDHAGVIVMGRWKLTKAGETVYSAKPLWWYSLHGPERAATVLEVWMYKENFVPYEGWRLWHHVEGEELPLKGEENVWRSPFKITRSESVAKAEHYEARRPDIEKYEALFKEAKEKAREWSAAATKYRLKLAVLKRIR